MILKTINIEIKLSNRILQPAFSSEIPHQHSSTTNPLSSTFTPPTTIQNQSLSSISSPLTPECAFHTSSTWNQSLHVYSTQEVSEWHPPNATAPSLIHYSESSMKEPLAIEPHYAPRDPCSVAVVPDLKPQRH